MQCVNLKNRFGKKYKIKVAKEYSKLDSWNFEIPCKYGYIYPYSSTHLGFASATSGGIANKVAKLECTQVIADGDDGKNIIFHINDCKEVFKLVKPKTKRVLSKEQREANIKRLAKYSFKKGCEHEQ